MNSPLLFLRFYENNKRFHGQYWYTVITIDIPNTTLYLGKITGSHECLYFIVSIQGIEIRLHCQSL